MTNTSGGQQVLSRLRVSQVTPLLAAVAVGLIAAQPLLTYSLPRGTDTLYHLQRAASLLRALEQGILYPRWSFDLAYGFGYPVFNYYASLSYYPAAGLAALGLSVVDAITALAVALYIAQPVGMWLWLREEL
ncbi:MAG: hypothetical protein RMN25_14175, partial [Anaerolineae bacterium]|nr:hypothetical protein [Thermoflexales bacterium]MDW8408917.1 hypothetical protein [Anaerolineae bacterium]